MELVVAIGHAEQQVDRAGPQGRRAHPGLAGEAPVDLAMNERTLLVTGEDVLDR